MTAIESAIKEAIMKGGYHPVAEVEVVGEEVFTFGERIDSNKCLLDPLFWQALGKARGWEEFICPDLRCQHQYSLPPDHEGEIRCPQCDRHGAKDPSEFFNLRLISHLHKGMDAESFFTTLV